MKLSFLLILFFCSWVVIAQRPAKIIEQPANITVSKQYRLNSSYREVNMSITPDGRYLFFMSSRGEVPWATPNYTTYKGHSEYDGDIWYSERIGKDWQAPKVLDQNINTRAGEDEPNISPDGQTVYFQSWHDADGKSWRTDGGPYYKVSRNGNYWGTKIGLGSGINDFFVEKGFATDGMSLSPDGKTFVVACGSDYDGAMDLYISYFKNGVWTYPQKMTISTPGDERSPFIAADGETLYFASEGYQGSGGLDIFKVSLNEARTTAFPAVYNIGAPFNTSRHDYGFMITSDGKEVYFIRDGDIYFADVKKSPKEMKPNKTLVIKGVVRNAKTKAPLNRRITFKNTGGKRQEVWSNVYSGEYIIVINNPDNNYQESVLKDTKFKGFDKSIVVGEESILTIDIDLEPIESQVDIALRKKKEEERLRKLEEIRIKKEQERLKKLKLQQELLRNQEAACRM
ncbi:MAG: hypothetical protein SFU27_05745 [Thermonemataceae bacterium]|nr:hypothetical protein [Thermonemataceae bacterium]